MAASMVSLVLLARQPSTASAVGETAWYRQCCWRDNITWKVLPVRLARHLHVGFASSAGDTGCRHFYSFVACWKSRYRCTFCYSFILIGLQVATAYIYRVACMVKKQSRVGLGFWPLVLYIFFYKTNHNILNFYTSFSSPSYLLSQLLSFCEWVRVFTWVGATLPLFCFCCVAFIIQLS